MNIIGLDLHNWLAHRYLSLDFSPLTLLCGPNESGKTAAVDAIAFAMLAEHRRIEARGDRGQLLTLGAAGGYVAIRCGSGPETVKFMRDIASGRPKGGGMALPIGDTAARSAVRYVLDPGLFARAKDDERRAVLLDVMRVSMSPSALLNELEARGHLREQLTSLPMTEDPAQWVARCDRSASEARGVWKGITGEVYGSVKAEGWAVPLPSGAPDPAEIADTQMAVADLRQKLALAHTEQGAIAERRFAHEQRAKRRAALVVGLSRESELRASLEAAEKTLEDAETKQTEAALHLAHVRSMPTLDVLKCSQCGRRHLLKGGVLVPTDLMEVHVVTASDLLNAQAAERTTQANLKTARAIRNNLQRSVDDLDLMRAELARDIPPDEVEDANHAARIGQIEGDLTAAMDRLAAMNETAADAKRAAADTDAAAKAHEQVKRWVALAEAISPSGIPAELLSKALGPYNQTLMRLASEAGWPCVTLGADMRLSREGLPYGLLSESARWKADLLLTLALAIHGHLKFMVVDRFDVLELAARRPLLVWLYGLTKAGTMDTIILAGTLKEPPKVPGDVRVHWLGQQQAIDEGGIRQAS
jgi:hypothetical protein